jgi:peptidoglycan hydrolase-like protein with peptidoglycan-binding domain
VHTLKLGERTLRRGVSPGADVRELKRLLQHKSRKPKGRRYFARGVKVDGNYGIGVRRGVRRFQKDHKMKVDGVVGPKTLRAIRHAPTRR